MLCPECRKEIPDNTETCPHCAINVKLYMKPQVKAAELKSVEPQNAASRVVDSLVDSGEKSMDLMMMLLLGGWVWLKSGKNDLWKFIFFAVGEVAAGIAFAVGIVRAAVEGDWMRWMKFLGLVFIALLIFEVMIRLWVISENIKQKKHEAGG